MAGRSLVPSSTSGRGCLFILVAVIVLGLTVAGPWVTGSLTGAVTLSFAGRALLWGLPRVED